MDGDPQGAALIVAGWSVVSESWGARLHVTDDILATCRKVIDEATHAGWQVRALGPADAQAVASLDAAHLEDYPPTMATMHDAPDADELGSALANGTRWGFGAFDADGLLAAATILYLAGRGTDTERVETDFTVTRADSRRRGLAKAVKAAAILAFADAGRRVFGSGGAAVNAASRHANESLGYVVTERWLHLQQPVGG
jgi:GNAT superfamily N-acetyltransferase